MRLGRPLGASPVSREPLMSQLQTSEPRAVMVTGAADGIGWATAQHLAAAGHRVLLTDRNAELLAERHRSLGPDHGALRTDVSQEADLRAAVAQAVAQFGGLDILINNAGITDAEARPTLDQPIEAVRALMAVNVRGVFLASREAFRVMQAQGSGTIVNLASGAGLVALPLRTAYGASKAAVLSLTRTLACEWARHGVRVNAVSPGYTRTDMVQRQIDLGRLDPTHIEARIPWGRLGEAEEIAAAIAFMALDEGYITGANLVVDGGYAVYGGLGPASRHPAPAAPAPTAPASTGARVIAVTGGGRGIGRAVVDQLRQGGDHLLVLDRDPEAVRDLGKVLGADHLVAEVDVTDPPAVDRAFAAALARWGRLDVLVNNAGSADVFKPTLEQDAEAFDQVFEANFLSALIVAQAAARVMAPGGAIVNLGSIAGLAGQPRRNAYGAAKAALMMMTRNLACEWASAGLRVNTVAPGYIETPAVLALRDAGRASFEAVIRRTPMGRLGTPEEVARAILFLASPEASYVTGATLSIDGGWSAFGDAGDAS